MIEPLVSRAANLTEVRLRRMVNSLKNAMTSDPDGRLIVAAMLTILQEDHDLSVLFEGLCTNFVARHVLHENRKHIERSRNENR